ncbi:M23 family metallopeptidase [Tenuibacillus multivorans]|uniref:Stage IV sporulation protein FA n=1 Tax=Tenuibacillus multivorans TaxID=237069 RepID=A0A1G9ZLP6_9BACI|nr:M23 family metallopeptidase [Tenuibacillus multivorans]GEL77457.1 hypothetical protein TMU01_16920 [Tenuibacillus multivorans]SDN21921.1 stage IV sporulation protein FA [Tenuibacillus multivorans]
MSRKLNEIRSNIAKRKMNRNINFKNNPSHNSLLDDEERHGYTSFPKVDFDEARSRRSSSYLTKFLISTLILFFTLFIYQTQIPILNAVKPYVHQTLTEDLPFATVQAWYDDNFATPLLLFGRDEERVVTSSPVNSIPVSGVQMENLENYDKGVYIEVTESQDVTPMARGSVMFAGKKPETGQTVIVQHEDGTKSIYGHLNTIDVFHYQFVSPGQKIGTVEPDEAVGFTNMYFAVQEDSQYIDPVQFILGESYEEQ